jgi:two-component system response regulator RegX3
VRLLIAEDDAAVRSALEAAVRFRWREAEVLLAADGPAALALFQDRAPDLVLLDVGLPGASGYEVLAAIRRTSDVPVVVLTGRSGEADQVRALDLGADAHVAKPFSPLALLARLEAVLRRSRATPAARTDPDVIAGSLAVDLRAGRAWVGGREVALTRAEYALLAALAAAPGQVLTQGALVDRVWGGDGGAAAANLKVLVSRLRSKLGPGAVETVRGLGYRLALHAPGGVPSDSGA